MDPTAAVTGFTWRQDRQSVTEGILMWPEPFIVKDAKGEEVAELFSRLHIVLEEFLQNTQKNVKMTAWQLDSLAHELYFRSQFSSWTRRARSITSRP